MATSILTPSEQASVNQTLAPVVQALRKDIRLRREFARYAIDHGADPLVLGGRLKKLVHERRNANAFLAMALYLFGCERGLVEPPKRRPTKST